MNRLISHRILMAMVAIVVMLTFNSCEIYQSYPPPGHNDTGYDRDLTGYWELAYINGDPVHGYEVNWLDFYGNGYGMYYYNDGPYTYELPFEYYCEYGYDNWLYIHYSDGTYAEMTYWFNHNYTILYLEWFSRGRRIVYTYYWVDGMYWSSTPIKYEPTRNADISFGLRPGIKEVEDE